MKPSPSAPNIHRPHSPHSNRHSFTRHADPSNISTSGTVSSLSKLSTPPPSAGFMSHLTHILPRHTQLHVRIQIHRIASVPLVSGDFACKWKLKGVQNMNGRGLLHKKHHHSHTSRPSSRAGKEVDQAIPSLVIEDGHDMAPVTAINHSGPSSVELKHPSVSNLLRPEFPASPRPSSSSGDSFPFSITPLVHGRHPNDALDSESRENVAQTGVGEEPFTSDSRGQTAFEALRDDHSVRWEYVINAVVRIPISRSTSPEQNDDSGNLAPCPLRLTVIQDPKNMPNNPRLGVAYLDVSEYAALTQAGEGRNQVMQRFLLSESKINATLQVTISLSYHSGSTAFICPPLPRSEILAGISGFGFGELGGDEVYQTRPRALSIFDTIVPHGNGGTSPVAYSSNSSVSLPPSGHDPPSLFAPLGRQQVDTVLMPYMSPQDTELLIDAIFNPVPVPTEDNSPRVKPFVIHVPADHMDGVEDGEVDDIQSMFTTTSATTLSESPSGTGTGSNASGPRTPQKGSWWRRRHSHCAASSVR
ncbi:hypothetical protein FISHEDRAFT_75039 [Fistulina hepatica ATCC 64428]|uniref:C2 NT-type domain-containing protein n=1 Tax=Fistulina hepatica ATCC 64428 TaxID=1128425 RepID=A0A0D7A878_9AGAR|nr:hypothetical protein FISHEDRAFT_75039 [Fistulina hepatica ATCC 64428]